jgi:hypothetical protein
MVLIITCQFVITLHVYCASTLYMKAVDVLEQLIDLFWMTFDFKWHTFVDLECSAFPCERMVLCSTF